MAITLTESRLRQIIREEVSSLTRRQHRVNEGLKMQKTKLYAPSDRVSWGQRAVVTGTATLAEEIAVECQGWFDPVTIRNAKRRGIDAVAAMIMSLSEFKWQTKKRGLEATPELAAEVAKIFIDLDLT